VPVIGVFGADRIVVGSEPFVGLPILASMTV
jgi:hypothetical protein